MTGSSRLHRGAARCSFQEEGSRGCALNQCLVHCRCPCLVLLNIGERGTAQIDKRFDVIYFKNNISSHREFRATGCRKKPPPSPRRNRRWSAWQPCRTWTSNSWRCSSSNWIKSSVYFRTLCTRWRSRRADFRNPALASRRLRQTPRVRQISFSKA